VDYWDRQGWKGPFSSAAWTARQYEYSGTLHNGSPYTPERVMDGTEGFVGSQGGMARQEIEKAAAMRKSKVAIIEVSPPQKKSVAFRIGVEKLLSIYPKDTAEVIVAITESGLQSSVQAEENSGTDLHQSPVVRDLKVIGVAWKERRRRVHRTTSNLESLRAVVFVQERIGACWKPSRFA
jgi:hypothetical protein